MTNKTLRIRITPTGKESQAYELEFPIHDSTVLMAGDWYPGVVAPPSAGLIGQEIAGLINDCAQGDGVINLKGHGEAKPLLRWRVMNPEALDWVRWVWEADVNAWEEANPTNPFLEEVEQAAEGMEVGEVEVVTFPDQGQPPSESVTDSPEAKELAGELVGLLEADVRQVDAGGLLVANEQGDRLVDSLRIALRTLTGKNSAPPKNFN